MSAPRLVSDIKDEELRELVNQAELAKSLAAHPGWLALMEQLGGDAGTYEATLRGSDDYGTLRLNQGRLEIVTRLSLHVTNRVEDGKVAATEMARRESAAAGR